MGFARTLSRRRSRGRRLRFAVDGRDDAIAVEREAHGHDVGSTLVARPSPAARRVPERSAVASWRAPLGRTVPFARASRGRAPPDRWCEPTARCRQGHAAPRRRPPRRSCRRRAGRHRDAGVEVGPGYSSLRGGARGPAGKRSARRARCRRGCARKPVALGTSAVLVLAVDLPFVDAALLAWLASHPAPGTVVPVVDGLPQTPVRRGTRRRARGRAGAPRGRRAVHARAAEPRLDGARGDRGGVGRRRDARARSPTSTRPRTPHAFGLSAPG